ncbi:MAG: ATP-binding protein [Breznakiellaceae bacterium]
MQEYQNFFLQISLLYAQDPTTKADIDATNLIKTYFHADTVAIFFQDLEGHHHYSIAGSPYTIALSQHQWDEIITTACRKTENKPYLFGPYHIPLFEKALPYCVSLRFYASASALGYLLLGREYAPWSEEELTLLTQVAQLIAPIVHNRVQRLLAEYRAKQVTEEIQAKEYRLRTLLETAPMLIYTATPDDRIITINHFGIHLLGLTKKEDILNHHFAEFFYNPSDREYELRRLEKEGMLRNYEIILKGKNEIPIYAVEFLSVLKDKRGNSIEHQGIIHDITERILHEKELWKSNLELSELNNKLQQTQSLLVEQEKLASLGQLAAGIAHEINNPLGFIKSNHQTIKKYLKKIEECIAIKEITLQDEHCIHIKDLLNRIQEIIHESDEGFSRIMNIVSDLKLFSRVDQSEDFLEYDIHAGINSTLVVAWNSIKYIADVHKDFGDIPLIRAHGSELNQVWLNIIMNAVEAIESQHRSEKGNISIKTWSDNTFVYIQFQDDGPGIPQAIQKRIFDPFFTTKPPGKGTGLGLSITYNIITNIHKGKIAVHSKEGEGTCFTIALPISVSQ